MCKQSDVQIGGRPPAELMNRLIRHGRGRVPDLFIQLPSLKKHTGKDWELPVKMWYGLRERARLAALRILATKGTRPQRWYPISLRGGQMQGH